MRLTYDADVHYISYIVSSLTGPGVLALTQERLLTELAEFATMKCNHDIGPWPVKDPKWDGLGQLIYCLNMVHRGNADAWKMVGQTALAMKELLIKA
jgi:hypothetical protein